MEFLDRRTTMVTDKPQTSTKQINLRLEDCEIIYSVEVANAFNSYFSSLGNDLVRTIPSIAKKKPHKITYTIVSNLVSLYFPQLLVKLKMKFPN